MIVIVIVITIAIAIAIAIIITIIIIIFFTLLHFLSFFLSFLFFFTSNSILNYFNKRLQLIWLTLANRATESRLFPFSPFLHLLRSKFRLVLSPSSSLYLQEWLLFRSGYYIVYFVIYIRIKTGQSLCF